MRSTEMQFILTIHEVANAVQGASVLAVVLEIAKVFDQVSHRRLLKNLQQYGIHDPLLKWLELFLTQRSRSVVCEDQSSRPSQVISGVLQGTVLGHLLVLLYINDLPDNLQFSVRLFSHDALLYRVITNDAECDLLQSDLCKLEFWQKSMADGIKSI